MVLAHRSHNVLGLLVIQETDTHSMSKMTSCRYRKSELLDQIMNDKYDSYIVHNSLTQVFHSII